MEKSSIAKPSFAPEAEKSVHRMRKIAPFVMLKLEIIAVNEDLLADALPSIAPVAPDVIGAVKSSELKSVQVPVVREVASKLY
jgi:hypothetical protein